MQDGLRRMCADQEDVFYYLTVENENYAHPPMPEGAEDGILRGMHPIGRTAAGGEASRAPPRVGRDPPGGRRTPPTCWPRSTGWAPTSGASTSFTELRREGMAVDRWNRLHPLEDARASYVQQQLPGEGGPVVAATDYMRSFADQIRPWVAAPT